MFESLEEGRCAGILPAARGFLEGFAEFCLRAGVVSACKGSVPGRLMPASAERRRCEAVHRRGDCGCVCPVAARGLPDQPASRTGGLVVLLPGAVPVGAVGDGQPTLPAPHGAYRSEQAFKACVVGIWQNSVIWPRQWMLVSLDEAEITVGRKLVAAADAVSGEDIIGHL